MASCSRGLEVVGGEREARAGRLAEAEVLHRVEQVDRLAAAEELVAVGDDPLELLLPQGQVVVRHLGVEDVVEDHAADGGLDDHAGGELLLTFALEPLVRGQAELDHRVDADLVLAEARKTSLGSRNAVSMPSLYSPGSPGRLTVT